MKAFLVKFVASLALLYIVLGLIYGMSFRNVFLITFVLGVSSFILGDMIILRRTNNIIATIADFGLAFVVIWLMSKNVMYGSHVFVPSLIATVGVTLFEIFFHKYIVRLWEGKRKRIGSLQYMTEASDELTPDPDPDLWLK
ncbi:YndM family protein [Ectobacillus sp. sgz5001026]|uniref:YndM family protein n=1 Tax=Ectobacillus sp. sgz5001026 TaxID=3242473 RepID=UPI0036D20A7C